MTESCFMHSGTLDKLLPDLVVRLISAQSSRDPEQEASALKNLADVAFPLKRVNATSVLPMPYRFFDKIIFGVSECWHWRGSVNRLGYGCFNFGGETKAHRVSWMMSNGKIPVGAHVLHRCDNRQCVNPDHLFLGTHADNMRDREAKGRANRHSTSGEDNPMATLTWQQVQEIRGMVDSGERQVDVCRKFGVSPMTVSRIVRRETWK